MKEPLIALALLMTVIVVWSVKAITVAVWVKAVVAAGPVKTIHVGTAKTIAVTVLVKAAVVTVPLKMTRIGTSKTTTVTVLVKAVVVVALLVLVCVNVLRKWWQVRC